MGVLYLETTGHFKGEEMQGHVPGQELGVRSVLRENGSRKPHLKSPHSTLKERREERFAAQVGGRQALPYPSSFLISCSLLG